MNISKIRQLMDDEGIVFSFSGLISQSLTEFMVETASKQFADDGYDKTMIKSMFLIAIEQLQNVMSYSKQKHIQTGNRYTSPGVLLVGFDDEKQKYYVSSSNEIIEEDKIKISTKIDFINSLDTGEQRKYLREKLKSAEDTHDRGAGVGFIEIAKRSSEKLEYDFEELDGKSYFHIKAYI
ncbi:MAG: SiaB family protein kinase [Arcobacteraceae bacterium]|nr:SiaB family protein kinase [Arcobacteraceae bacterium]